MPARFITMRSALQKFHENGNFRNPQTAEEILNLVLETAKRSRGHPWEDIDINATLDTAREIFMNGDPALQAKTLHFMENLINVFFYDRKTPLKGLESEHERKLIEFYFDVVLRYAIKPALLTRACQYAEKHTSQNDPNRQNALEAFKMSWFAEYAIEKFEKKAVKKLLIIAKEKILCHSNRDPLMPGTIHFIGKVCENQKSCGVMIRVCHVLRDLFKSIAFRRAMHEFDMLKGSPVFPFIMKHTELKTGKKCWVALAALFKVTFKFADYETKEELIEKRLFPRIKEMLSENAEDFIINLVEAVTYAAKDRRIICHLLTARIYPRIIELYGQRSAPGEVRMIAGKAIAEFLKLKPYHEMFQIEGYGIVPAFMNLLSSSDIPAVSSTLDWIDMMLKECSTPQLRKKLACLIFESDGNSILNRLCNHSETSVGRLAESILLKMSLSVSEISSDLSHIEASSKSTQTVSNPGSSYTSGFENLSGYDWTSLL